MSELKFSEVQDPRKWGDCDALSVGDPLTEEWLDRIRGLMVALKGARAALVLADEYLLIGEGVGLRYYFYDSPDAHARFEAALADADITLPSDYPK